MSAIAFLRRKRVLVGVGVVLLTLGFLWKSDSSRSVLYSSRAPVEELDGFLYMVSHTEHILPEDLDVTNSIAPSVWTPNLPSSSRHWRERMTTLARTPVIVFSKTYCPYSREAKKLLARYKLDPPPKVVEVDTRSDGDLIKRLLIRLTNRRTFPNVILRGRSLGGFDDIRALHAAGTLRLAFENAGVQVTGDIEDPVPDDA
ncbi:hypothetical protein M422DRAFT_27956 [Sphaerobolus stellatus SS14]|nr:hypothetical protein M422DRAFT_27956 [Sphaerobolus stellatus SS14]